MSRKTIPGISVHCCFFSIEILNSFGDTRKKIAIFRIFFKVSFQSLERAPRGSKQTDGREDRWQTRQEEWDWKQRADGRAALAVAAQLHEMKSPCRVCALSP
jgi:hypothetical protein